MSTKKKQNTANRKKVTGVQLQPATFWQFKKCVLLSNRTAIYTHVNGNILKTAKSRKSFGVKGAWRRFKLQVCLPSLLTQLVT